MDVQEIRDSRKKSSVIFAKFCQNKDSYDQGIFCFFEGEDKKYYEQRIEEYTGITHKNIFGYDCGGKHGVLKVRKLISEKEEYDTVKKAYFIDRDYFFTDLKDVDIYETPCYSVENFYTSETAFEKILIRAFGINAYDEDFKRCVNDYKERQKEFHQKTVLINAWLKCQRKHEICNGKRKVELTGFKVAKYFSEISIEKVELKKCLDVGLLHEIFPNAVEVTESEMKEEIECMCNCNQQNDFRGKFELEFLKKIIDDLRTRNKECNYFQDKCECVKLDPNVDTLFCLSHCADTPDTLVKFLSRYRDVTCN